MRTDDVLFQLIQAGNENKLKLHLRQAKKFNSDTKKLIANACLPNGECLLNHFIKANNTYALKILINFDADPTFIDTTGHSPMQNAGENETILNILDPDNIHRLQAEIDQEKEEDERLLKELEREVPEEPNLFQLVEHPISISWWQFSTTYLSSAASAALSAAYNYMYPSAPAKSEDTTGPKPTPVATKTYAQQIYEYWTGSDRGQSK